MQPPQQLVQWVRQTYPKPSVDENWLSQCYAWVVEEHNFNPATDIGRIKEQVESQLLMSDLTDSMAHGTGLPQNLAGLQKGALSGPPILVQIMALTEIGHSAFSLMNVRQTKIDRADLSGLAQQGDNNEDAEADEGPVPNYPRSMLQFELSDGTIKLNAIEYRKIPQLDLENTPLGYKIQLKNVSIRHGIAFLEPRNVVLKGYGVEDLDLNRDRNFLNGLRLRLDPNAQNEPEADGEGNGHGAQVPPPVPAPAPAVPDAQRTARPRVDTPPAARPNVPPIPGPSSNDTVLPPPLPTVNGELRRPQPLARLSHRTPRLYPSVASTSQATSSHFSTPGTTTVAPMRLSPTRAATEPLADEPPEPGSDWYFGHDGIDASFLSRAASELERSEALLSQSSQQSIPPPSQPQREVIVVDEDDDKENNASITPGDMRHALGQLEIEGSMIDVSVEVIEGARIQHPIDNDDVISIGSDG